jgi:hypothetical protein
MTALGSPAELRDDPPNEEVRRFLTRSSGGEGGAASVGAAHVGAAHAGAAAPGAAS